MAGFTLRPVMVWALLALLGVIAVIAFMYGIDAIHHVLHSVASIVGDPHQCNGPSPGPGCGT